MKVNKHIVTELKTNAMNYEILLSTNFLLGPNIETTDVTKATYKIKKIT